MDSTLNEVKDFVQSNLGKEVIVKGHKAMIVGYSKLTYYAIISFTKHYYWNKPIRSDVILIHSPLNVSFSLVSVNTLKELLNEK